MAAHDHLAKGQFHRREGRPNKVEHDADGADEHSNAPHKPHVHEHKSHPLPKRGH